MIEGILSIQRGEVPAILNRRLEAFLNDNSRARRIPNAESRAEADRRDVA
jgi:flagellar motor component MotA